MSGSNAGVPIAPPADAPERRGPFMIWRGHPSPIPWFGRFEASPAFAYTVADRQSDALFSPVCHRCVVELIYRFGGFCDVRWELIEHRSDACDWCDLCLLPSDVSTPRTDHLSGAKETRDLNRTEFNEAPVRYDDDD